MLKGSRRVRTPDTRRIGKAVSYPGIDPRQWCVIAVVVDQFIDPVEQAPFCEVAILHSDPPMECTVRVGTSYGGPGFGDYQEYQKDDEVLVVFPAGVYDHGGWIVARAWSPSDPMPKDASDDPTRRLIRIQDGRSFRIVAGADVWIEWAEQMLNFNASIAVTKAGQTLGVQGDPTHGVVGQFFRDAVIKHYYGAIDTRPPVGVPASGAVLIVDPQRSTDSSGFVSIGPTTPGNPMPGDLGSVRYTEPYKKPPKVFLLPANAGAASLLLSALTPSAPTIVYADDDSSDEKQFEIKAITGDFPVVAPVKFRYKVEG